MLKALEMIDNPHKYSNELWLKYLLQTKESNYNYAYVNSMSLINNKSVFNYIKRALDILDSLNTSCEVKFLVEETLKWSDVAKCGLKYEREKWTSKGYNLKAHNQGSAEIYKEMSPNYNEVVYILIRTHGLLGQYIQGEINLVLNTELYNLIEKKLIDKDTLNETLKVLNYCIMNAVSPNLYEELKDEIEHNINLILENNIAAIDFYDKNYLIDRFKKLRKYNPIDNYDELSKLLDNKELLIIIGDIFKRLQIWYFEVSFRDFSLLEVIKIFLIINSKVKDIQKYEHLTFEHIMKSIYLEYENHKAINLYKKRIIESYLKSLEIEKLISEDVPYSKHLTSSVTTNNDTIEFSFDFSLQATKLIEFCESSYGSDEIYDKAIILLYDLFGFRRDKYDRFYNEEVYLHRMNASLSHKAKILEYIEGNNVLDIGPGGGSLMDLITEELSEKKVYGIDISENVIDALIKKKNIENRRWNIIKGDALNLEKHLKNIKIDTIIYSSIIHELYSYIETDGKKFNKKTILNAITSAYNILSIGGRIIIRDGIMTEPKNQYRIIEFKNIDDLNILNNYCNDFEGRIVTYEKLSHNKVKMLVNDAMEFLYTYTWGPKSYALEIKEQFGYFTPSEFIEMFKENFDNKLEVIELKHFLQDGYEEHLLDKITIYDEYENVTKLPDSTCIIVIKKVG